ncbi:uncharacterized protein LOC134068848 [Sardina pilchardus]|uniref:uncharacterized protein LOC134068848 n=1 Tax=Sardina pilchardus TaxID=27697 RepID=UPI002E10E41A
MANIESELNCNICLDLLNDPHHYPCGHSFCLRCINALRNSEIHACPDCRRPCPDRTDIVRDFRLKNILEAYRQNGNVEPTQNTSQPSATVWLGRQDPGILLVIVLLLFISVYAMFRLERTEQALQGSQILTDSTHPVTFSPAKLERTEDVFQDSQILPDSQPEHLNKVSVSPGPLYLLLAPLRWLWLLVEGVVMCVWWLISSLIWLVFQCVWLVFECVRLVFVSIWEVVKFCFCFVFGVLIQSFSIFVYICGLASIAIFSIRFLRSENQTATGR